MAGLCCTDSIVREAMSRRGWTVMPSSADGPDREYDAIARGVAVRAFSCTHLVDPDSVTRGACQSAFLRLDLGRAAVPPTRWAIWTIPRSERVRDVITIQVSASEDGATLAAAWSCRPDEGDKHPGVLLVDKADELAAGLRSPQRSPPMIRVDPIWGVPEWSSGGAPLGRDHAQMGVSVLATTVLAWPIWVLLEAPEAAVAWLASVGFTGIGLLVASRIHRIVSVPSPRAGGLFRRLKATDIFEQVQEPRVAEALVLPVAATLRRQRTLDHASVASTLLRARGRRPGGRDLRLALRTVSWPQATALQGRVVPKAWLSLELAGEDASTSSYDGIWAGAERGTDAIHVVLDAEELDRWNGRI